MLAPRGMTPIRTTYESDTRPATFLGSQEEYTALLERGATRLMIDTFHLSFENRTGIVAWADQELFDAWTTDAMGYGDCWKIMLGRRIKLSPDDLDGSEWLGNFLEEALLTSRYELYETVKESSGIWVTRPTEFGMKIACWPFTGEDLGVQEDDEDYDSGEDEGIEVMNNNEEEEDIGHQVDPIKYTDNYTDCESDNEEMMYFAEDESETEEEARIQEAMANDPSLTHSDLLPPLFEANSDSDSDMVGSDWDSDGTLSSDEALKHKTLKLCEPAAKEAIRDSA
ncbi:hypothetical protein M422DRAFT_38450 [Sphaerobolus stellatus SS14]|uniref:DUF8191 domain-containing protein n=1 Tax=Sphaerobolus stellatus (strain SS14) TaxID=990650 RepID=A0A0C9UKS3_SPHS4|nr:hypothetical protein M422DRAFT_38450 [Sphaerobolus stellatus SS14]